MVGYALNAAIGLQVFFGTLTTGLAVVVSGHKVGLTCPVDFVGEILTNLQAQVSTAVLGRFAYLPVSYTLF